MSLLRQLFLFSFGKDSHQRFKALKKIERGTLHKDVASSFGVSKNTLSTWEKITKKKSTNRIKMGLELKEWKYKALNKVFKKLLLILRSKNVLANGPLPKEKALEFAFEPFNESFKHLERWLEKWKKIYLDLVFFNVFFYVKIF